MKFERIQIERSSYSEKYDVSSTQFEFVQLFGLSASDHYYD